MKLTTYQSVTDRAGVVVDLPWEDIVDILSQHERRPEKNGPAVVWGEVVGPRSKKTVRSLSALSLDIEHKSDAELDALFAALEPFEYVCYSTHSHTLTDPRLRIVLPLSTELPPDRLPGLKAAWALWDDPATKDPSRLYFLPSAPEGSSVLFDHHPGQYIDQMPTTLPTMPQDEKTVRPAGDVAALRALLLPGATGALKAVLDGQPFAKEGERHNRLVSLTWRVCRLTRDAASVKELFYPSAEATGLPTTEVDAAVDGAMARILGDAEDEACALLRADGVPYPYTADDLSAIAETQGVPVAGLTKRWIITTQPEGMWYLLTPRGYTGPIRPNRQIVKTVCKLIGIPDAVPSGASIKEVTAADLETRHGLWCQSIVADMTRDVSVWKPDDGGTLYEATSPKAGLTPTYHEDVAGWLKFFGPKVTDWLSVAPSVDRTICGLYLFGPKGTGKTLLPTGLAKIWGSGMPTDFNTLGKSFTEGLTRNPIILADEGVDRVWGQDTTVKIRQIIGTGERWVSRKFKSDALLRGAPRLVLASNEHNMLSIQESIGKEGFEALAQRLAYVEVPQAAADYLERFSKAERQAWADHKIAEHVLWLSENHKPAAEGKRWAVEGDLGEMMEQLRSSTVNTSLVSQWAVKTVLSPETVLAQHPGEVVTDNEHIYVTSKVVDDTWCVTLGSSAKTIGIRGIGTALKALRCGERKKGKRYHTIEKETLITWAETNCYSTRAELEEGFARLKEKV